MFNIGDKIRIRRGLPDRTYRNLLKNSITTNTIFLVLDLYDGRAKVEMQLRGTESRSTHWMPLELLEDAYSSNLKNILE